MDRVRQRLDRGDDDRVAGVDAERIDILHRAHGDAGVVGVAHHLVLDLLPADEAALDHDLADRAGPEPGSDTLAVGRLRLDDPTTGSAEGERRADDRWQADLVQGGAGGGVALLVRRPFDDPRRRVWLADPIEQVAEALAILGHLNGDERRPEELDVVALEGSARGQRHREVEGRLATEAREESLRPLLRDDRLDGLRGERLEVDRVGDLGVGHDRRRVAVDEDRPDALGPQSAAGLRSCVIELGGLADDDRARAEDQDGCRLRHATACVRGAGPNRGSTGHISTTRALAPIDAVPGGRDKAQLALRG